MAEAARSASLQAEACGGHKGHNAEGQTQGAWKGLKLGLWQEARAQEGQLPH